MLASAARTLSRRLGHAVLRAPTNHAVYVYGLCAGLISGVLWTVIAMVSYANPLPETAKRPILTAFALAIELLPIVLIAACGARLGWRNGSARDGLLAGVLAGAVWFVVYASVYEATVMATTIGGTQAWHESPPRVLIMYALYNLISSLTNALIGGIVGGVGGFIGRRWHRRDQPAWPESVGLAVCGIGTAELDAELLEIVAAETLGGQLPTLAE